ncbi:MAG: UDP-N-acetylglucosamine 2-epimerase (non-hydrolyzing) [Ilumatobacteraceae bacterium]|nr:UDP-N-acetylglucosamine 2-epimerase (non-hydrolyzing) [Ilumatobacteraceae bacterium]
MLTLVGTRPELIKLSRVIPLFDKYTDHTFVHTGQNYSEQLNAVFFEQMKIRLPDVVLSVASDTPMKSVAQVLEQTDSVLARVKPDAMLVLGDTNSALAVIAAKRRKIPVFHLEAGNRAFDDRTPEEINRRIVDHTSDINMAYSHQAKQNLLSEGLPVDQVFCVGSPMKEIFDHYSSQIAGSEILNKLDLTAKKFFIVSLHREENVDNAEKLESLISSVEALANRFDLPVIFSTHPRTQERLKTLGSGKSSKVKFVDSLGFFDYVKLQRSAFCVVSDSGTLTEEASLLSFPAVTLRESHERPEGTDVGTLVLSSGDAQHLISSVEIATDQFEESKAPSTIADYLVSDFSWRVLKIVTGYVEYVNQRIWYKTL